MGQPMEHVLRQSLIALRLAEYLGLAGPDRAVVCFSALLAWLGCHVAAYEQAKWFGDDLARSYPADMRFPHMAAGGKTVQVPDTRFLRPGRQGGDRAGPAIPGKGRRAVRGFS